jgi:hypothetical protein
MEAAYVFPEPCPDTGTGGTALSFQMKKTPLWWFFLPVEVHLFPV